MGLGIVPDAFRYLSMECVSNHPNVFIRLTYPDTSYIIDGINMWYILQIPHPFVLASPKPTPNVSITTSISFARVEHIRSHLFSYPD